MNVFGLLQDLKLDNVDLRKASHISRYKWLLVSHSVSDLWLGIYFTVCSCRYACYILCMHIIWNDSYRKDQFCWYMWLLTITSCRSLLRSCLQLFTEMQDPQSGSCPLCPEKAGCLVLGNPGKWVVMHYFCNLFFLILIMSKI